MANIRIAYEYRDGSNCHRDGEVIVANATNISRDEIYDVCMPIFDDGNFFIADQLGLPERFHWKPAKGEDFFPPHDDDHCWHSFSGVEETDNPPTQNRDIMDFLVAVKKAQEEGWKEFTPTIRYQEEKQAALLSAVKNILLNLCDRGEHRYLEEEDKAGEPTNEFALLLTAYAEAGGNLRQDSDTEDWPQWAQDLLDDCKESLKGE